APATGGASHEAPSGRRPPGADRLAGLPAARHQPSGDLRRRRGDPHDQRHRRARCGIAARRHPGVPSGRHAEGPRPGRRGQPVPGAGVPGRLHPDPGLRRRPHLHGAQGVLRRRRRADLPAAHPGHREDRGRHPRRRPPREAVLPAQPARQGRQDQGEARGRSL
ncbi:MAG: LSU ribosomal protein L19p, partial [uncultured Nocardioidaceae bacterium]